MPRVSVLDLSPVSTGSTGAGALANTLDLAELADRLGFHRYWLAEHHSMGGMLASTSPEVLIGHVASATERIRVGSGGMMLPNHSPLHLAEQFRVLEALHPSRIDLGIGRAPGTDSLTAYALRGREASTADDFPQQLGALLAFARRRPWPDGHPFAGIEAAPADAPLPPVFLLGSSDYSARLAAVAGLGFAFAAHINPAATVDSLALYRDSFEPSGELPEPLAILAHNVICAPDDEQARRLAASARVAFRRLRTGRAAPIPALEEALEEDRPLDPARAADPRSRLIVGRPETVRAALDSLMDASGADELMLTGYTHDHADRRRSYELIAAEYGLDGHDAD